MNYEPGKTVKRARIATMIYGVRTVTPDRNFPETMIKTLVWGERRPKGKYLCFPSMEAMESHCKMNDMKMIKA